MKTHYKIILFLLLALSFLSLSAFLVLTRDLPVLDPKGIIALKEKNLLVTTSLLMMMVVIPVFAIALGVSYYYRQGRDVSYTPEWEHSQLAESFWWGVPVCIIFILSIITWKTSHDLDPFRPLLHEKAPIEVQVVALQWKWLFIYPKEGIATLNFLQCPEKTPLNFTLTGDSPMNSFWIPRLGGQIYAMAGMRSKIHLLADEVGEYRGSAAHISGTGFSRMVFSTKISSEEEFLSWVNEVRSEGESLSFSNYEELAKPGISNEVRYYVVNENLFEEIIDQYKTPKLK